jgi:hypothetical protein
MELLYGGIDQSLKVVLLVRSPITNVLPKACSHVCFNRGNTWNENLWEREGEILNTETHVSRFDLLIRAHHTTGFLM